MVVRYRHRQAPARLARDEPRLLEQADALAHRGAVDPELAHQLRFGADGIAGLEPPGEDLLFDCLRDLLVGRARLDAFEPSADFGHFTRCICGPPAVPAAAPVAATASSSRWRESPRTGPTSRP